MNGDHTLAPRPPGRQALLEAAQTLLADSTGASVDAIAAAAGLSKTTFYRHFRSRAGLLAALDVEPDVGTRERILAAGADIIGRDGLADLSMDEVAAKADVSRATVYRVFPGKSALIDAVIVTYSPVTRIEERLAELGDEHLEVVLPELYRMAARAAAPRIGLLRAIFFGVTSGSDDALEGVGGPILEVIAALSGYLERQMDAGRLRRTNATLAAQILIGPMLFHLFSRPYAHHIAGFEISADEAAEEIAATMLRGFATSPAERVTDEPASASGQSNGNRP